MILDAIIGLFVSLCGILAEGVAAVFVPLINLIAAGIEAVVGIFVSGFSLGRIERRKGETRSAGSAIGGILTLMEPKLIVGRTVLGAGLDSLADRLLKATKE